MLTDEDKKPLDWSLYLAEGLVASEHFMQDVEKLPAQEREPFRRA